MEPNWRVSRWTLTFGCWQQSLLLGAGVLELVGRERLELALEVDGDLRQILQSWGGHCCWLLEIKLTNGLG